MKKSKGNKKRIPKIVYTVEEEDWLVKNALEYSSLIENKKTDGATNRDKDNAWEKIAIAFNVAPPGQERALKSLREKYSKIKQTLKDRAFYFLRDAKKTGGGPPKKELPALSEPLQQLAVLLTPSTLGLAAISGDSDHSIANKSAQYASRKIASSSDQMQSISIEEIIVDDGDMAFHLDDGDVNDTFFDEAHGKLVSNINDHPCSSSEALTTIQTQPVETPTDEFKRTKHYTTDLILSNEGAVVDRTWERVNPAKLRKPLNALLHSRWRKMESKEIPTPSKFQKLSEEKQQHSANKYRIEIEILEGERERYKFERERAALDLKRAAIECERAELDRERSAIELQRAKNQLAHDKEFQRLRFSTFQPTTFNDTSSNSSKERI